MAELLRPRPALEPQTAITPADPTPARNALPAAPIRPPVHPPLRHGRTIHVDRSRLIAVAALGAIALVVVALIVLSGGDDTSPAGNDARAQTQAAEDANSGEGGGEGGAASQGQESSGSGVPEPSDDPDPARGRGPRPGGPRPDRRRRSRGRGTGAGRGGRLVPGGH